MAAYFSLLKKQQQTNTFNALKPKLFITRLCYALLSAIKIKIIYAVLPQHFLYLRPLPQIQGSLRPIFGVALVIGVCGGGQQLVSLQLDSFGAIDGVDKLWLLLLIIPILLRPKF